VKCGREPEFITPLLVVEDEKVPDDREARFGDCRMMLWSLRLFSATILIFFSYTFHNLIVLSAKLVSIQDPCGKSRKGRYH